MNITFYTFSKKLNSTKRPAGGSSYNCTLKRGSSKMAPYIELSAADPTNYNYAYIPAYGRYYYIDNWTFQEGLWSCDMSVDVLATFKTEIGETNLYVLRSSSVYNEKIADTLYPATAGCSKEPYRIDPGWTTEYPRGSYVLGVVSKAAAQGALAYYVLSYEQMAELRGFMMTQQYLPDWFTDWDTAYQNLSGELVKAMINPFQYIASCTWLPFQMSTGGSASLDFGYWSSGLSYPTLAANVYVKQLQIPVDQTFVGTSDEWRRQAGYAKYQLNIQPFGVLDLDPTFMAEEPQLSIVIHVDPITGMGKMKVAGSSTGHIYGVVNAMVGVPVQLAQLSTDPMGAIGSAAQGVGGLVSGLLGGNISGAFNNALSGIGDTTKAMMPTVSSTGGNGGVGSLAGRSELHILYMNVVDRDNVRLGRPLCETRRPADIGGYILAQSGSIIDCAGSKEEKTELKSFIETGFYYE